MKPNMEQARQRLTEMLEQHDVTAGMYVRISGDHLIAGRRESFASGKASESSDRVRLTRLGPETFGLSVKRHTGRWEKTPFSGPMNDVVSSILGCMQHLVADY